MFSFYVVVFGILCLMLLLRSSISLKGKVIGLVIITSVLLWVEKTQWCTSLAWRVWSMLKYYVALAVYHLKNFL